MSFFEKSINELRQKVSERLSEKRFLHTVSVAKCAVKLAELCKIESKYEAEAASLLHDITKECSFDEHIRLIKKQNIFLDEEDIKNEGVLHSFSAPEVIKTDFAQFATDKIISAVRYHTLGSPSMTVFDEIIFLADFIEDTRAYDASIALREFVFSNMKEGDAEANILFLHKACIKAIDATLLHLIDTNKSINSKNILTRNALLSKI